MTLTTLTRTVALAGAVLITSTTPALAGPPLICHPFDIGGATSLPFDTSREGWAGWKDGALSTYDRSRLVDDTLALLAPQTPVIVRMETLRRASAYAATDASLAKALLAALEARAAKPSADALAAFDAGYLIETFRQLGHAAVPAQAAIEGRDGYAFIQRAIAARPRDAELQFAAALATARHDGRTAAHVAHARQARAGAKADTLLARNVSTHLVE